jgi:3',5'-cyclic AMP phosphodiesterase CpdA
MKRRDFLHCSAAAVAAASFASSVVHADVPKTKLQFNADGKFKIAQFTDTHYRTNNRDVAVESVNLIAETLEAEKPQLAVFTGDIVVSGGDVEEGWDELLAPCVDAKVPYAVMLGNHDHEGAKLPPRGIIDYIAKKPYSVTSVGPEDIFGASNYILEIYDGDRIANLLYCLDSNAYNNLDKETRLTSYDWFRPDQIAWYKERSAAYKQKNGGQPVPALAFFHIPLNEYGEMIHFKTVINEQDTTVKPRGKNVIFGVRQEKECPGAVNSGMFAAMLESGDVLGTFAGHDHVNDYVALHNGIALGYGRWSGTKTTYGADKMTHGSRLFELAKDGGRSFRTWVRVRGGEKVADIQVPQDLIAKK